MRKVMRFKTSTLRMLAALSGTFGFLTLVIFVERLSDIRSFEIPYIYDLFGAFGILMWGYLALGFSFCVFVAMKYALTESRPAFSRLPQIAFAVWLLLLFWAIEWIFMEVPVTVRLQYATTSSLSRAQDVLIPKAVKELRESRLYATSLAAGNPNSLAIMYQRIKINRLIYTSTNIIKTLEDFAARYEIDPTLLFYWLYLDSFYGEAVSSRVPFFNNMTGETFRDFVQAHLPRWFVESKVRRYLIESDVLERLLGHSFGWKLGYAFHKATLDLSVEPYEADVFSDVFTVLRRYKNEFPEIFENKDLTPLDKALHDGFLAVETTALPSNCEEPYSSGELNSQYYDEHGHELIDFSRAVFYKLIFDFRFATKIQVLTAKYMNDYYIRVLGPVTWNEVSTPQKLAMMAMTVDVFKPNVGRLGNNLYALPELNCVPLRFVAENALKYSEDLINLQVGWRPPGYEDLWAGAETKLFVFNEVWRVVYGKSLPGLPVSSTLSEAHRLLRIHPL